LVGKGSALQGKEDVFNASTGTRWAFKRALEDAFPNENQEKTRQVFWKEYHKRYKAHARKHAQGGPVRKFPHQHIPAVNPHASFLDELYRRAYTPHRQAEDRCHRVVVNNNVPTAEAWASGVWDSQDQKLTIRMRSMKEMNHPDYQKVKKVLGKRTGVVRYGIGDQYCIVPSVFVPAFKVGEMVTRNGVTAEVVRIDGMQVIIQPVLEVFSRGRRVKLGPAQTWFEWELKKKLNWKERIFKWATTPLW
jgi:hypothetical protein